jgi:hypothetical protein
LERSPLDRERTPGAVFLRQALCLIEPIETCRRRSGRIFLITPSSITLAADIRREEGASIKPHGG